MTDKEVMQMALDAITTPHPGLRTNLSESMIYREKIKTTIEALRTALAQPKKEWQGLTDEDRNKLHHLIDWTVPLDIKKFADSVEAVLKGKNT